jgi:hypothetical protein
MPIPHWRHSIAVMIDPAPLPGQPDTTALLREGGSWLEHAAAADRTLAGLGATADAGPIASVELNHLLAQGTLGGVQRSITADPSSRIHLILIKALHS